MDRRKFLEAAAALTAASAHGAAGPLPRRPYRNGIDLSIIAFGGIVVCGLSQDEAARRVAQAYRTRGQLLRLRPVLLRWGSRNQTGRSIEALPQPRSSSPRRRRAGTPGAHARNWSRPCSGSTPTTSISTSFTPSDPWKMSTRSSRPAEPRKRFSRRRKEGKVRHLGFSAHHAPAALRLMDALELDSVLFPVNANAWENGGFGPQILAKAKSKGMARMALKALAFGKWPADLKEADRKYPKCWYQPIDDREMARLALRFTLNQEVTAAVPPGDERIFDLALELASAPLPRLSGAELDGAQDADIHARARLPRVTVRKRTSGRTESRAWEQSCW